MICYRDRSWCASAACVNKCGRKLTEKDEEHAIKWWGNKDFPVDWGFFCDNYGEPLK